MNNEIKEILDRAQELVKHKYDKEIHTYNLFDDIQGLLDYITNLQEGNHNLLEEIEYMQNKNNRLIEENEKLKDDKDGWHRVAQRNYNELLDRIDKAIEYIKQSIDNPQPFYEYLFGDENGKVENLDKLLNILQGEDIDE